MIELDTLFTAVHESACGTKLPFRDVRYPVAIGGRPDMAQNAHFGRK